MNLVNVGSYLVHNKHGAAGGMSTASFSSSSSTAATTLPPAMLHAAIHQPTLARCLLQVIERREQKDGLALAREVRAQMLAQKLPDPSAVLKLHEILQDDQENHQQQLIVGGGSSDRNHPAVNAVNNTTTTATATTTNVNENVDTISASGSRGLKRKATGDGEASDRKRPNNNHNNHNTTAAVHKYYLIFEGFKDGEACDLLEFLKLLGKVPEAVARGLFRQLAEAVSDLHGVGIIHGDLKLPNVLVVRDPSSNHLKIKVKDFRYSTILTSGAAKSADSATRSAPAAPFPPPGTVVSEDGRLLVTTHKGSPAYLAPEVTHLNQPYDGKRADTYAVGVILYTMIYGTYPITASSLPELFEKIRKERVSFPAGPSKNAVDLMAKLLDKNALTRFTLKQALRHPWIYNAANDEEQIVPLQHPCAAAAAVKGAGATSKTSKC